MPAPNRSLAPWLPATTDALTRAVIERAMKDLGICEQPLGSNRSPRIDEYLRASGVPESVIGSGGGYWCAAAVAAWWREAGAETPPSGTADCDVWLRWAKVSKRWSATPSLGGLVLYGKPGDASHIGQIIRTDPVVLSVEGNTTVEGSAFERNGTAVALKRVASPDPILGYVTLRPA